MNNESKTFNVLIADDHPLFINGLKPIIESLTWVGEIYLAYDGEEVLQMVNKYSIQLILLDVNMPYMDGFECLKRLRSSQFGVKVIVISAHGDPQLVRKMIRLGANGYMTKTTPENELKDGIHHVMFKNMVVKSKDIGTELPTAQYEPIGLSEREMEVLISICNQKSAAQIGKELGISKNTIDIHRGRLMKRAGVNSIAGLVKWAYEKGVL